MRVDVHEAGCYDFAGRVDDGVGVYTLRLIDADDAPVEERDVGVSLRGTGAIDHATVADGDVYSQRFPLARLEVPERASVKLSPPRGKFSGRLDV